MVERPVQRHSGAFEVCVPDAPGAKTIIERLNVVSRNGLLQRGDKLPPIKGSYWDLETGVMKEFDSSKLQRPAILGFVNEFGTPECDSQAGEMENLSTRVGPNIMVIEFSRQAPKELSRYASRQNITHPLIPIDNETAVDLGVALEPETGENGEPLAEEEFWSKALCRTLAVVGMDQVIRHIEQLMDQEKQPNYEAVELVARELVSK